MNMIASTPAILRGEVETAHRLLWIFDGGLDRDLESIVRKVDHRAWIEWIYSGTEYAREFKDGPMLVESNADSALLDAYISSWAAQHWGGLLLSAQPFDAVLQHLRALRHAQLPDGTTSLLRLHEPRAMRGFAVGSDSYTTAMLMGPIDRWYWCEWNEGRGDWYRLDHPSPGHGQIARDSLNVSDQLLGALDDQRIDYRNLGFVRRLRAAGIPGLENAGDELLAEAVRKHAADAQTRGFSCDEDMYGFLDVYFRYHRQLFAPGSALAIILDDRAVPAWRRLQQANALMEEGHA